MAKYLKEHGLKVLGGFIVVYVLFIMQLGQRSFMGHVVRILKTPEAQELGDEVVDKVVTVASGARRRAQLAFTSE
jgi:hypothetical protein